MLSIISLLLYLEISSVARVVADDGNGQGEKSSIAEAALETDEIWSGNREIRCLETRMY